MIKTQVQIPDELYRRAKQVAADKEWSFAEVVRRGLEHITQVNPAGRKGGKGGKKWRLPGPYPLGAFMAPEGRWTELAHEE